jgi:class 3 adenylate cyclase
MSLFLVFSVRHPTQVFTLLEAVYNAFDKIADRRGVFTVETIGDSYVAVCGYVGRKPTINDSPFDSIFVVHEFSRRLPEVRRDHAGRLTFSLGCCCCFVVKVLFWLTTL